MTYREAVENRRSIRNVTKNANLGREEIVKLLEEALVYTPSGYNMQNVRLLLLMGEEHDKFWNQSFELLMAGKSDEARAKTRQKFDGFQKGLGTVLFFDDMDVVRAVQEKMPSYAAAMEDWMHHGQGMMQYVIWTGLEEMGLGASLQHYNPVVDDLVRENWNVPKNWVLRAQMPFGGKGEEAGPRDGQPAKERYMVFGDSI